MSFRPVAFLFAALVFAASAGVSQAQTTPVTTAVVAAVPSGTAVRVLLLQPLASNTARTGDSFQYQTVDDVVVAGNVILPKGSTGTGTVKLAGAAGGHGHEGDLTLDFGTVAAANGNAVAVNSELIARGRNLKTASWLIGGALVGTAIRGSEVVIPTNQVIDLLPGKPAKLEPIPPAPAPSPKPA
jgi:hypothetical protein